MDVAVKDNNEAIHQINTDVLDDGSETQVVKLQLGDVGRDGGYASQRNPVPVELVGFFKRLFSIFGRFSFGTSSALRTEISNSPSVSINGTPTMTVTTGNMGFGDMGKASTVQQITQQAFMTGIRQNFTRA